MYVYIKTGSALAAALAHSAVNFVTSHLVGKTDIGILKMTSGEISAAHLGITSVMMAVGLVVLVRVFYRCKMKEALLEF